MVICVIRPRPLLSLKWVKNCGKTINFTLLCFTFTLLPGVTFCEYPDRIYLLRNYKDCATRCCKPHDCIFIRLDNTPECDEQTERQTGGRTDRCTLAITACGLHCKQCGCAVINSGSNFYYQKSKDNIGYHSLKSPSNH